MTNSVGVANHELTTTASVNWRCSLASVLAALALLLVGWQSMGLFGGSAPSLLSPISFILGAIAVLSVPGAPIAFGLIFVVWSSQLLRGRARVPKRTLFLWVATLILSTAWFCVGWEVGREFQGNKYLAMCALASCGFALAVGCALLINLRRPSFLLSLGAHFLLFAWIATYAFPWIGES